MPADRQNLIHIAVAGTHGKSMSGLLLKHILDKAKIMGSGDFIESIPFRKSLTPAFRKKRRTAWGGWEWKSPRKA
jgi:hypothetical protein